MGRARSKAWIAATQKIPRTEHLHRMNTLPPAIAAGFVAVSPEAAFPGAGGMPVRAARPGHRRSRGVGRDRLAVLPGRARPRATRSSTASPPTPRTRSSPTRSTCPTSASTATTWRAGRRGTAPGEDQDAPVTGPVPAASGQPAARPCGRGSPTECSQPGSRWPSWSWTAAAKSCTWRACRRRTHGRDVRRRGRRRGGCPVRPAQRRGSRPRHRHPARAAGPRGRPGGRPCRMPRRWRPRRRPGLPPRSVRELAAEALAHDLASASSAAARSGRCTPPTSPASTTSRSGRSTPGPTTSPRSTRTGCG